MVDLPVLVCGRLNSAGLGIEFRVERDCNERRYVRAGGSYSNYHLRVDFMGGVVWVWYFMSGSRDFLLADPDFYSNLIGHIAECC